VEVTANYTHLSDKITKTSDPFSQGKYCPVPHDALNFWTTLTDCSLDDRRRFTAVSHRYADTRTPRRTGLRGLQCHDPRTRSTRISSWQLNLNNVTDKLYFTGVYFVGAAENHALLPRDARSSVPRAYRF